MTDYAAQNILLESGTNEMEILEFFLGEQSFGINVQKLQEIICFDPTRLTPIPESPSSVLGVYLVREKSITLVDLAAHLRRLSAVDPDPGTRPIVLVCQFNRNVIGFLVDGVNQIHRINWREVEPMAPLLERFRPRFTGTVHVAQREMLIVDFEHILAEIDPETGMAFDHQAETSSETEGFSHRGEVGLMVAEDSVVIRHGVRKVLSNAGYSRIRTFADGLECYEELTRLKARFGSEEDVLNQVRLLVTDIEMPRMDGLTLCRKIREDLGFRRMRVVLFSSLISEQMDHKCKSVGADTWISKPQIPSLIQIVDNYCLSNSKS